MGQIRLLTEYATKPAGFRYTKSIDRPATHRRFAFRITCGQKEALQASVKPIPRIPEMTSVAILSSVVLVTGYQREADAPSC